MTAQSEVEKAVAQPWKAYATPEEVLADKQLSSAEKRRILESWERDARELAVAEEENMGGGEPNMLDRVMAALSQLPLDGEERPRGPATMHGSQPTTSSAPDSGETGSAGEQRRLSGQEARQGEIILRTPMRKAAFVGALVVAALVAVLAFNYAAALTL